MMKLIFAGTPEFSLLTLRALINSSHKICGVYTQPDRPAGRGQKLTASPVKQLALAHNLPIYQPLSLKDQIAQKQLQDLNADIFVDVAYGLLLPKIVLNTPKFGCINIHPSLLPRFRGAAPIQRTIMAGETTTGVTIMKMDVGFDTGDIYKQATLPIENTDTTATLMEKTAKVGAKLLLEVLTQIENGSVQAIQQNHEQSTYANKISKEEGKVDWHKSAQEIDRMVRAFNPWPIAYTQIDGKYIRIWQAAVKDSKNLDPNIAPGTIIHTDKNGITVATGNGSLCLLKIQLPGGKPLQVKDVLNAHKQLFATGQFFSTNKEEKS